MYTYVAENIPSSTFESAALRFPVNCSGDYRCYRRSGDFGLLPSTVFIAHEHGHASHVTRAMIPIVKLVSALAAEILCT